MKMITNPEWENARYAVGYIWNGKVVQEDEQLRFNEPPPEKFEDFKDLMAFALKHAIPRYVVDKNCA